MFDGRAYTNYGAAAIQARAFDNCTALADVKFADNYDFSKMTVVGNAFEDCRLLTLPSEVTYVDGSVYQEMSKGDKVDFSCDTWVDTNFQIYGCKYHGDRGQLEQCTFYDAYKYGIQ